MTNEDAIRTLYELGDALELSKDSRAWKAIDMAISALKENPKLIKEVERWQTYFEDEVANEW